jgi:hypothetical protein
MKVKLKNGRPAAEGMALTLEHALGCRLSDSFKGFISSRDGAKPETNIFKINEQNDSGVNGFIPVAEIQRERAFIEDIPAKAYPVAWAEGGNYVFIDEGKNGAVYFWDHEAPQSVTELAANFGAFLDPLEPFDINTIELKPGQVKKVWVDPEFLNRLKK